MEDPFLGWKILTKCLKTGGLMAIGLYSELARKHVVEIRREIKNLRFSDDFEGIKSFRKIIKNSNNLHHKKVQSMLDFYTMSTLRDLLFHVQEHRFTIPQIKKNHRCHNYYSLINQIKKDHSCYYNHLRPPLRKEKK